MKLINNEQYEELKDVENKYGECRAIEEKEGNLYDVEICHQAISAHGFGKTEEEAVKNAYKHMSE
jgi:hypothetical protein